MHTFVLYFTAASVSESPPPLPPLPPPPSARGSAAPLPPPPLLLGTPRPLSSTAWAAPLTPVPTVLPRPSSERATAAADTLPETLWPRELSLRLRTDTRGGAWTTRDAGPNCHKNNAHCAREHAAAPPLRESTAPAPSPYNNIHSLRCTLGAGNIKRRGGAAVHRRLGAILLPSAAAALWSEAVAAAATTTTTATTGLCSSAAAARRRALLGCFRRHRSCPRSSPMRLIEGLTGNRKFRPTTMHRLVTTTLRGPLAPSPARHMSKLVR
jgi:hypothetical protein